MFEWIQSLFMADADAGVIVNLTVRTRPKRLRFFATNYGKTIENASSLY